LRISARHGTKPAAARTSPAAVITQATVKCDILLYRKKFVGNTPGGRDRLQAAPGIPDQLTVLLGIYSRNPTKIPLLQQVISQFDHGMVPHTLHHDIDHGEIQADIGENGGEPPAEHGADLRVSFLYLGKQLRCADHLVAGPG